MSETIGVEEWAACEEFDPNLLAGVPEPLSDVPDAPAGSIGTLTGSDYLYTDHSLGLSAEAQEKLRELVDGRGAVQASGKRVRWRTISLLEADLTRNRQSDTLFGSKVSDELRSNLKRTLVGDDARTRLVLRADPAS